MKDTEISINGKPVAGYDLIPPVPVNSDNIDKVLYEPLNELYGVTDDINEKLSKMLNFMDVEIESGTIAYLANGIVKEGNYGVKTLDSISGGFRRILLEYVDNTHLGKKVSYSLEVVVNGVRLDASFTYKNKQAFTVDVTDCGRFNVTPGVFGLTNTKFKNGDKISIKVTYQSDCKIPVLLDSDINDEYLTGFNDLNKVKSIKGDISFAVIPEIKLVTDSWVSKYVQYISGVCSTYYIVTPETSLIEGQSGIRLPLRKLQYRYNDTDTTYARCVINRLGILPDNFIIHYEGMIDGRPDSSSNEIIEFTWGEVPGTFIVESNRGNASQVHTLVKNFDKFEPNTKYVIWIRSCIVFAFKAEPDGNLSIS